MTRPDCPYKDCERFTVEDLERSTDEKFKDEKSTLSVKTEQRARAHLREIYAIMKAVRSYERGECGTL